MNTKCIVCILICLNTVYAHDKSLFEKYGNHYNIPSQLLWGIAKRESNFNPFAFNRNKNGTYDIGLMQINTIHLRLLNKNGIEINDLFHPETNIAVGSFILSECFQKHGLNWKGLTCYNGRIDGNDYAMKVLSGIAQEANKHNRPVVHHLNSP